MSLLEDRRAPLRAGWWVLLLGLVALLLIQCSPAPTAPTPDAPPPPPPSNSSPASEGEMTPNQAVQIYGEAGPTQLAMAPRPDGDSSSSTAPTPVTPSQPSQPTAVAPVRLLVPQGHWASWMTERLKQPTGAAALPLVEVEIYQRPSEVQDRLSTSARFDLIAVSDRLLAPLVQQRQLAEWPAHLRNTLPAPHPKFLHHYADPTARYSYPYALTFYGYGVVAAESASPPSNPPAASPVTPPPSWQRWSDLARTKSIALTWLDGGPLRDATAKVLSLPAENSRPEYRVRAGEIAQLKRSTLEGEQLVLPTDRVWVSLFYWALPASSERKEQAKLLLQKLGTAENLARLVSESGLAATQPAVIRLLPEADSRNPLLYPSEEIMDRAEFLK